MNLIVLLVALGCLQVWGAQNPFHRDNWFYRFSAWLSRHLEKNRIPKAVMLGLIVGLPALFVAALVYVLPVYMVYPVGLIALLFALGRGEFASELEPYNQACDERNWALAIQVARNQGVSTQDLADSDWPQLNQRILESMAYQGFERLFAVLFWFVFFGPAGALLYRLSFLYQQHEGSELSSRWLWVMEWPAVRVLSVSFAVTGNFVGCINRWQVYVFCQASSSGLILRETVLGALSIDDELVQSCDCTQREIRALRRLYARTLWFWVALLAIWTIL